MAKPRHLYNFLTVGICLLCGVDGYAQLSAKLDVAPTKQVMPTALGSGFQNFLKTMRARDNLKQPLPAEFSRLFKQQKITDETGVSKALVEGGWNGSGGGGGLACAAGSELNTFLRQSDLAAMSDFRLMDLADSNYGFEFKNLDRISEEIEGLIETRLSRTFPVFAQLLLSEYRQVRSREIYPVEFLDPVQDVERLVADRINLRGCGYVQWIRRYHSTNSQNPHYVLLLNTALDKKLKQTLSPHLYRLQWEVLLLHEAIYGLLMHIGVANTSYPTRALIQYVLTREADFKAFLAPQDTRQNGTFWYFWIFRLLPGVQYANEKFLDFVKESKIDANVQMGQDYIAHLKFLDQFHQSKMLADFAKTQPGGVLKLEASFASDPSHPDFQFLFDFLLTPYMALYTHDESRQGIISSSTAFFLWADRFVAEQDRVSAETAWLSAPASSHFRSFVCKNLQLNKDEENRRRLSMSKDQLPISNVKKWTLDRAFLSCGSTPESR